MSKGVCWFDSVRRGMQAAAPPAGCTQHRHAASSSAKPLRGLPHACLPHSPLPGVTDVYVSAVVDHLVAVNDADYRFEAGAGGSADGRMGPCAKQQRLFAGICRPAVLMLCP